LVGLDWQKLGAAGGSASTSAASSERWAAVAELKIGEPVFRAVDPCRFISTERLAGRGVALIVKSRVKDLVKQRGRSEAEARELVA
jgi:hypothetical protein